MGGNPIGGVYVLGIIARLLRSSKCLWSVVHGQWRGGVVQCYAVTVEGVIQIKFIERGGVIQFKVLLCKRWQTAQYVFMAIPLHSR
jgi:hypothetical protein